MAAATGRACPLTRAHQARPQRNQCRPSSRTLALPGWSSRSTTIRVESSSCPRAQASHRPSGENAGEPSLRPSSWSPAGVSGHPLGRGGGGGEHRAAGMSLHSLGGRGARSAVRGPPPRATEPSSRSVRRHDGVPSGVLHGVLTCPRPPTGRRRRWRPPPCCRRRKGVARALPRSLAHPVVRGWAPAVAPRGGAPTGSDRASDRKSVV